MIINSKTVYRSAADGLYHVQGEDVSFATKVQAETYCLSGRSLTELEAEQMTDRLQFIEALQAQATVLAQTGIALDDMTEVYIDREYSTSNPFTPEELATLGLTIEQVVDFITIVPAFLVFVNEEATRSALNAMRTDL